MIYLTLSALYVMVGVLVVRAACKFMDEPILGPESFMLPAAILTWPMQLGILLMASNYVFFNTRRKLGELELEKRQLLSDCSIDGPNIPRILKIEKEIEAIQGRS